MSTTPVNKINDSLLVGGVLDVVGGIATQGGVFARTLNGIVTENGAGFGFGAVEVEASLSTSGATTTISLGTSLPAGAVVGGGSIIITEAITGADSTDVTLKINASVDTITEITSGGPPPPVGSSAASLVGFPSVTTANACTVVLSGGGDNTPTGGKVRVALFILNVTPLLS